MKVLPTELRNQLERTIIRAREAAEAGARAALEALAVHHPEPYSSMTLEQRALRNRLRARGRQLGDRRDPSRGTQTIDSLILQCAYEHWHRMLFARFLAENHLLIEPDSGVAISMEECKELARDQGVDPWLLAGRFAQRMLPQIFRADDPVLEVTLPPETRQELQRLLADLPPVVFTADDALGWTYQFWQSAEKERVNSRVKSGEKITGRTLPAVTQLFTEHYMVLFLLHNTLGAWYAGKVLAENPDLARHAKTEQELRDAVALDGYTFDYLRFVRDQAGETEGLWRPASGAFEAWPRRTKDLRMLDPCCGSGHFLVAAFALLVRLRMADEGLPLEDAIRAVLAENLFGLELDTRCTQIAVFNLALAAWKMAGRVIDLPALNIACSGLSVGAPKTEWIRFAGDDDHLKYAMDRLYDLFEQAPELGSLINPQRIEPEEKNLFSVELSELEPLLQQVLRRENVAASQDGREIGVTAQGAAKAGELLAGQYHLVITNVPYLARGKQSGQLRRFCEIYHPEAKNDLATVFLERCLQFCPMGGTTAIVLPQNWLFLTSYRRFREKLLRSDTWHLVARLGEGGFDSSAAAGAFTILINISRGLVSEDAGRANLIWGIDAFEPRQPAEKAEVLRTGKIKQVEQATQLENPDAAILLEVSQTESLMIKVASCYQGASTGDSFRFIQYFWEQGGRNSLFEFLESAPPNTEAYGGKSWVIAWKSVENFPASAIRGREAWGKNGIIIGQMRDLPASLYLGGRFINTAPVIVPHKDGDLAAVWAFCSSGEFARELRHINQKLSVDNGYVAKVPFELKYWKRIADKEYPNGLPRPYSNDPTQWIFHGHPCGLVVWDDEKKWTAHGPLRTDATVLQVALARLLGYRWPAELDAEMELSDESRDWVAKCNDLLPFADSDGIVCLWPVRGEASAADRLRRLLASAYGDQWSPAKERQLLQAAADNGRPASTLEEWLRDRFFEEHCKLFHHRPFIWHIWDGRPDGFHALVNYHRLVGPEGEGRRTLEALTYTYLGDWIERQRAEQREGREGAEGRLAAALDLQVQLQQILQGEPPYDIFVRWKPLHQQPIGWEPDINDGVRLNIRPFMSAQLRNGGRAGAGILRWKPNINWSKDRGKEPQGLRPREDHPWFWGCDPERHPEHRMDFLGGPQFDGNRWNNLHYSNRVKQEARERASREGIS